MTEEVFAGHVEEAAGRLLVVGAVSEETLGFDEFDGANLAGLSTVRGVSCFGDIIYKVVLHSAIKSY